MCRLVKLGKLVFSSSRTDDILELRVSSTVSYLDEQGDRSTLYQNIHWPHDVSYAGRLAASVLWPASLTWSPCQLSGRHFPTETSDHASAKTISVSLHVVLDRMVIFDLDDSAGVSPKAEWNKRLFPADPRNWIRRLARLSGRSMKLAIRIN